MDTVIYNTPAKQFSGNISYMVDNGMAKYGVVLEVKQAKEWHLGDPHHHIHN